MEKTELIIGGSAYLDGRDPEAQPPLTVGLINLWDSALRKRVVGQLRHGTKVRVLAKVWAGGRWHYEISHFFKRGWVPGAFLSSEYGEAVGDIV